MLSMKKILILIFLFICVVSVYAGAPYEIRYNGKLKSYGSDANGTKNMNFLIFDNLTSGSLLWQSGVQSISVSSGIFTYVMQPSNVDWQVKDCYLEVVIDGKVMTPREKLTSVPYAIHADNGLVKGMIIMWYGNSAQIPDGWALCDGQTYNGVQTPDLRDRFVVGAGSTYNLNATGGETTHTLTVAEMPSHSHSFTVIARNTNSEGGGVLTGGDSNTTSDGSFTGNTESFGSNQAHENRPPYHALFYIMRVK
ncbi:hypothetical protein MASR1M68_15790 [Elusimicrobiota bacterium]